MEKLNKYEQGINDIGISRTEVKINSGKFEIIRFNSCDEMISKITQGIKEYKWDGKNYDINRVYRESHFHHGQLKTFSKTLEYLRDGKVLDSVLKKANEVYQTLSRSPEIEMLMQRAQTFKRKTVFQEDGAELCIDRVMCGDPAHWAKQTKGKKNTLVKLAVNMTGSCMENESLFNNLSAVTGVVTDLLIKAGFAVQLDSCSSTEGSMIRNHKKHTTIVTLKGAEEELDLQRIYSVGASGFFRCWIFQCISNLYKGDTVSGGLGRAISVDQDMQSAMQYDYVIDSKFATSGLSQMITIQKMFNEIIEHHG